MVVSFPFCHIKLFSLSNGFVFGVPEYQIRDLEALCQLCGVFYGTVVLLVRFEAVALVVEAEAFVEQPVTSLYVRLSGRIVGLITGAGEFFAVFQNSGKTELAGFGGVDVEEGDIVIQNV